MLNILTGEFWSWVLDLGLTAVFLILEGLLHALWFVLPIARIQEFIGKSLQLFRVGKEVDADPCFDADTLQLIAAHGYKGEEHYTLTKDGYVLCMHRILPRHASLSPAERQRGTPAPPGSKGVVLLMHGFMMCSEAWVARGPSRDLPLLLADEGYDVWLGNNRGNKYSHKHLRFAPSQQRYWDFCIDHLAYYDLPAMIEYILQQTRAPKLSYIGFSQGSAQAFAAFSTNEQLASRVNVFIALSPASRVSPMSNKIVSAVSTSRPELVFLLFGKKAMLPSAMFWRRALTRKAFSVLIERSMRFLFGWKLDQIDPKEKPRCFAHLYSFSSVKNVVHWFQIIHTRSFQMFDDKITTTNYGESFKTYSLPLYRPSKIKIPVALFYGEQDNILDIPYLAMELPNAYVHKQRYYEHLDFLWARDVHRSVYPLVMHVLQQHTTAAVTKPRSLTLTELVSDNYPPSKQATAATASPTAAATTTAPSFSASGSKIMTEEDLISPNKDLARFYAQRSQSLPIPPRSPMYLAPVQAESVLYGNAAIPGLEDRHLHKVESTMFEEESDAGI